MKIKALVLSFLSIGLLQGATDTAPTFTTWDGTSYTVATAKAWSFDEAVEKLQCFDPGFFDFVLSTVPGFEPFFTLSEGEMISEDALRVLLGQWRASEHSKQVPKHLQMIEGMAIAERINARAVPSEFSEKALIEGMYQQVATVDSCAICLNPFVDTLAVTVGDAIKGRFPVGESCSHHFCIGCIAKLSGRGELRYPQSELMSNISEEVPLFGPATKEFVCPLCRGEASSEPAPLVK